MNNNTDRTLFGAGAETEAIEIVDKTLTVADMEVIAKKIPACPNLRSLAIVDSGLSSGKMEPLIISIAQHPSLSELNFSGNNFNDLDFLRKMIGGSDGMLGNPHIHRIDLSGSEKEEAKQRSWANFVKRALEVDNLVSLTMDDDPWNYYAAYQVFNDPEELLSKAVNLLEYPLDNWKSTYARDSDNRRYVKFKAEDKQQWMAGHCQENRQEAERLLSRVKDAHVITASDVEAINKRLPAILYLGEKSEGQERIVKLLRDFFKRAQQTPGLMVDMGPFKNHILEHKSVPLASSSSRAPATSPSVISATETTYDIEKILAGLPAFDEAKARNQIEECLDHPAGLQRLGALENRTASSITQASLHVMAAMPTTGSVETSMKGFLGKFQEAQVFVEGVLERSIDTELRRTQDALLEQWPQPHEVGFLGLFGIGHKDTLADAAKIVNEASQHLVRANSEIEKLGRDIVSQIEATDNVSGGYVKVDRQIGQIIDLGRKIIGERRQKYAVPADNSANLDGTQAASHLELLETRLQALQQTRDNIKGLLAPYTVHAHLEQMQSQRISDLAEQHFPILIEEVRVLANHLQTSGQTSGREQSEARRSADSEAAVQTIQRIGSVVANMLVLFREADDGASEIRGHIGQLLPTKTLTQPAATTSHTVVKTNAERPGALPQLDGGTVTPKHIM